MRMLGFDTNFTIYDADDQKTLMKDIFRKFDIDTKIYKERGLFLLQISHAKDELITPEEMELNAGGDSGCTEDCRVCIRNISLSLRKKQCAGF